MTRRAAMDETTFLKFYEKSVLGYSKKAKRKICSNLEHEGKITFNSQMSLLAEENTPIYFPKEDIDTIISTVTMTASFMGFFEEWEFIKLYKYSVPVFFETEKEIKDVLTGAGIKKFDKSSFSTDYILKTSLLDADPMWYENDGKYFVKFVLQKSWFQDDSYEQIDYRYPIVIYIDKNSDVLEVRYDAVKYSSQQAESNIYANIVSTCLNWLEDNINLKLFLCEHAKTIDVINDKNDSSVRMYRQMMDLKSGGSAELKAAEGRDAVLPFVGELRELVEEYTALFNVEAKEVLEKYLNDIEATASYPYIYIKWENAVESQSYIVKITFDYLNQKYTLLQHLTGTCNDIGMERMNNAIKYLCESGSFTKGAEIKY